MIERQAKRAKPLGKSPNTSRISSSTVPSPLPSHDSETTPAQARGNFSVASVLCLLERVFGLNAGARAPEPADQPRNAGGDFASDISGFDQLVHQLRLVREGICRILPGSWARLRLPRVSQRFFTSGSWMIRTISRFKAFMIAGGVFAGASNPNHVSQAIPRRRPPRASAHWGARQRASPVRPQAQSPHPCREAATRWTRERT